ncbi:SIS domain-containing protein [Clostridium fallax]|uniref:Galactosamine 6-phosphate isomerase AgaS n=1 Tax=Clostridium fallax TaxID=1533 RepID=A0A1M4W4J0_9CLOT|nr:SIS domain-containing protein [Clostridium fallax]SHE76214.1 galactosamine 6-phosphate isomerase AgaS [Clostridium fallax]SQB22880.1 tagatose-6-phosphate aldose/ketose isomerase [Clostridium fallax]
MKNIFGFDEKKLSDLGATYTATEIYQQPRLWKEVYKIINDNKEEIKKINNKIKETENIRIVLTGAGTSAYVGDTVECYLLKITRKRVQSIATTDIVSNPQEFIEKDTPTILVSFARSGNSPESVGTYNLFEQLCDDVTQVVITCNKDGELAKKARMDKRNLVILMPEESNDKSFAMTSSFTCMLLTTLLIFDIDNLETKKTLVDVISNNAQRILDNEWKSIKEVSEEDFNRIVYLGSGSLKGLTKEAALKNLELTSGKLVSVCESILGFRHGPKSIINDETIVVAFIAQNDYTRLYDLDLVKEINGDSGNHRLWIISYDYNEELKKNCDKFSSIDIKYVPEAFASLDYIIFAQVFALMNSIKLGISPDNPRPDGTVNRVVKGVTIHKFE